MSNNIDYKVQCVPEKILFREDFRRAKEYFFGTPCIVATLAHSSQFNLIKYSCYRLTGCDLSYGPENTGNTTILENFLPPYRTFKVYPLIGNTSYWTYLVCRDVEGGWHASDTINFTTGIISNMPLLLLFLYLIDKTRSSHFYLNPLNFSLN